MYILNGYPCSYIKLLVLKVHCDCRVNCIVMSQFNTVMIKLKRKALWCHNKTLCCHNSFNCCYIAALSQHSGIFGNHSGALWSHSRTLWSHAGALWSHSGTFWWHHGALWCHTEALWSHTRASEPTLKDCAIIVEHCDHTGKHYDDYDQCCDVKIQNYNDTWSIVRTEKSIGLS